MLSSIGSDALSLFLASSQDAAFRASKTGREFLQQIARMVGAQSQNTQSLRILEFLRGSEDNEFTFALVRALFEGLKRSPNAVSFSMLRTYFERADAVLADVNAPESQKLLAVQLYGISNWSLAGKPLLRRLLPDNSPALQLAALETLGKLPELQMAAALLERWDNLPPRLRTEAIGILLAKADRLQEVTLPALESGKIRRTDLTSTQVNFLRNHPSQDIRTRAVKLFGKTDTTTRQSVVDAFAPALALTGDAARGKAIYLERCASCHRLDGQGFALGPDLVSVKNTGKEKILLNILDPNREVPPNYQAYVVETKDGESSIGLIATETSTSVSLKMAFGKDTVIPRAQIKSIKNQGLSLMPEGLEAGLTHQAAADLLEYIMSAKQ